MSIFPAEGGCSCGKLRFALLQPPISVHACYCRHCQRENGGTYAFNGYIEGKNVKILTDTEPEWTYVSSVSGMGQYMGRCTECQISVISIFGGREAPGRVIKLGTMDDPSVFVPIAQIYTKSKMPWMRLAEDIPAFEEGYDPRGVWSKDDLERYKMLNGRELIWW